MARLNRPAAEVLRGLDGLGEGMSPIHAATDVTGFGLIAHAREMASGSGVSFRIDHEKIEYLPGAVEAAKAGSSREA
jgi:selenide,water dikinase